MDTKSTNPPFVIYLQTEDTDTGDKMALWDMTWCYERIHESDSRYVRDDDGLVDNMEKLCEYAVAQGDTDMVELAHKVLSALDHRPGENDLENHEDKKVLPPSDHSGGDS